MVYEEPGWSEQPVTIGRYIYAMVGSIPHAIASGMWHVVSIGIPYAYHMTMSHDPVVCIFDNVECIPFWKKHTRWLEFICKLVTTWTSVFSHLNIYLEMNSVIKPWYKKNQIVWVMHGAWPHSVGSQPHHIQSSVSCDTAGVPTRVVRPHTPLNHLSFS